MIDYFYQNQEQLLNGLIIALIVQIILKYHKVIMDFIGEIIKFSYVYLIPLMFVTIVFTNPNYSLQDKQLLGLYFCGLGMAFGYVYRLAENIDKNQQKSNS